MQSRQHVDRFFGRNVPRMHTTIYDAFRAIKATALAAATITLA
jgi:hypothetical protein